MSEEEREGVEEVEEEHTSVEERCRELALFEVEFTTLLWKNMNSFEEWKKTTNCDGWKKTTNFYEWKKISVK